VDAFFTKFPNLQHPPFHPKWKETSLSAPLAGWSRLPAAQQWLDSHNIQPLARTKFDQFLKQNPAAAKGAQTEADRDALFKQFQAWQADQASRDTAKPENARAQARTSRQQ
jgi:hypothetical protein